MELNLGAPQMILILWLIAGHTLNAREHGRPQTGNYNYWIYFFHSVLLVALLWWGGFWG